MNGLISLSSSYHTIIGTIHYLVPCCSISASVVETYSATCCVKIAEHECVERSIVAV